MYRPSRNYYQIYRVDRKRNQEQMVDEVEGLHEAEKLVEKYLRNMTVSERKDEISYYRRRFRAAYQKWSDYRESANCLRPATSTAVVETTISKLSFAFCFPFRKRVFCCF